MVSPTIYALTTLSSKSMANDFDYKIEIDKTAAIDYTISYLAFSMHSNTRPLLGELLPLPHRGNV